MQLSEVIERLAEAVDGLEPGRLTGADASRLLELFERGSRLCEAGKTLVAGRAAECREWARTGASSPRDWLSGVSGTSPGQAQRTLDTAGRLADQPELADALKSGEISSDQADEISRVIADHPDATRFLIDQAKQRGHKGFKRACRQVALSSHSREEDQAKARRQRDSQYCRDWIDQDGMAHIDARLAPIEFATWKSFFHPFEQEAFDKARKAGLRDNPDRYRADALVAMAQAAHHAGNSTGGDPLDQLLRDPDETAGDAPRQRLPAMVIAVIDHAVFERGYALPGERHYIEGIGSVPVAHLQELMQDALIAAVVMKGSDVGRAVHLGRYPTALQKTALHIRDPECVIPGCEQDQHLEVDHIPEFNQTHHTTLPELARECPHHHDERTYKGAVLTGGPGRWHWQPPPFEGQFEKPPPGWIGGPFDDQPGAAPAPPSDP